MTENAGPRVTVVQGRPPLGPGTCREAETRHQEPTVFDGGVHHHTDAEFPLNRSMR